MKIEDKNEDKSLNEKVGYLQNVTVTENLLMFWITTTYENINFKYI